jgi:hypothetical protein
MEEAMELLDGFDILSSADDNNFELYAIEQFNDYMLVDNSFAVKQAGEKSKELKHLK